MKGKLVRTQLPWRGAVNALAKGPRTINDYSKITPSTQRDPKPAIILRKDEYAR